MDLPAGVDGLAGNGVVPASVPLQMRGQFLLDYIDLLLAERVDEREGFRHSAPGEVPADRPQPAKGRERWVVNKLRALGSWYTKGLDGGSRLRTAINSADSIPTLRQIIADFFFEVLRALQNRSQGQLIGCVRRPSVNVLHL